MKRSHTGLAMLAVAALVGSCPKCESAETRGARQTALSSPAPPLENASGDGAGDRVGIDQDSGQVGLQARGTARVAAGNNAFALRLFRRLARQERNLFFSPYALSSSLSLAYAGARGDTALQMATSLHLLPPTHHHPAFAELIRTLNGHGIARDHQLHLASALWLSDDQPLLHEFDVLARTHYGAQARRLDFRGNPTAARRVINDWIAARTAGKVTNLLRGEHIERRTGLILTSAVYFAAAWQQRFDADKTRPAPFRMSRGRADTVPLMHQIGKFNYLDAGDLQALQLPYEGGDVSMLVLLPRATLGLTELATSLTPQRLDELLCGLKPVQLRVALPRFRMTGDLDLRDDLPALGMARACSADADFSGIDGTGALSLCNVVHQAVVNVDEGGTEALAATAATISKRSPTPLAFIADRAFVFLIRDHRTNSILFLGQVVAPPKSTSRASNGGRP